MRTNNRARTTFTSTPWTESDLRSSLAALGATKPVYKLGAVVVDGHRRERICTALGIPILTHRVETQRAARQVLWIEHPERLIEETSALPLTELSSELGVSVSTLAAARKANLPRSPKRAGFARRRYQVRIQKLWTYLNRVQQGLVPLTYEGVTEIIDP